MSDQPAYTLLIVAGAPGSGKTTAVAQLLQASTPFTVLDIDWIIANASALAGRDIHFAPATWPAYNALWFDFLYALLRNGQQPIFFTTGRLENLPAWCQAAHYLLLDCPRDIQLARLQARHWSTTRIKEALADAPGIAGADSYLRRYQHPPARRCRRQLSAAGPPVGLADPTGG